MKRRAFTALLLGLAASRIAPAAYADRQQLSLSDINYDQSTKTLDVTHRIHLHDAQMALVKRGLLETPDLTPLRARAKLALLVSNQFSLEAIAKNGKKSDLNLDVLGAEIEGNYIYVYQQSILDIAPKRLHIDCRVLRGDDSAQINHVNVRLGGPLQTLIFKGRDAAKTTQ